MNNNDIFWTFSPFIIAFIVFLIFLLIFYLDSKRNKKWEQMDSYKAYRKGLDNGYENGYKVCKEDYDIDGLLKEKQDLDKVIKEKDKIIQRYQHGLAEIQFKHNSIVSINENVEKQNFVFVVKRVGLYSSNAEIIKIFDKRVKAVTFVKEILLTTNTNFVEYQIDEFRVD